MDIIFEYGLFFIGIIVIFIVGAIFAFLAKFPVFRMIFKSIGIILQTALNLLYVSFIIVIVTLTTYVLIILAGIPFDLFFTYDDTMFLGDEAIGVVSGLFAVCLVLGAIIGSFIFSFIPLNKLAYFMLNFAVGALFVMILYPLGLKQLAPEATVTFLGIILLLSVFALGFVLLGISSGEVSDSWHTYKNLSEKERKNYRYKLAERRRLQARNKKLFLPWIDKRKKKQKS